MTPWDTLNTEELSSVGNVPQKLFFGNDMMIFRTKQKLNVEQFAVNLRINFALKVLP